MTKSILVPIDGSVHAEKALKFACDMASRADDAQLHLLHIAQAPHQDRVLVLGAAAITVHASPEELEAAGRKVLDSARSIAKDAGCTNVETRLADGDPARRIVEYAENNGIDTIVMGSRGLSDWSGLMLGSVSHKVSHLAPCTCVTVR